MLAAWGHAASLLSGRNERKLRRWQQRCWPQYEVLPCRAPRVRCACRAQRDGRPIPRATEAWLTHTQCLLFYSRIHGGQKTVGGEKQHRGQRG